MGYTAAERDYRNAMRAAHDRLLKAGFAPAIVRARIARSSVSAQQLPIRTGRQLRILAAGNGAAAEDIGKFWFVVGYSKIGGPDIVPNA